MVNRHINFLTGEVNDIEIGWHDCTVDDLTSEMEDAKTWVVNLPFLCMNKKAETSIYGSYR